MAYFAHRDHPDKTTTEFMESIGAVRLDDVSSKHSVWSFFYKRLYIPLDKPVHHMGDLIYVVHTQAYNEGVGVGKQDALTTINQNLSNLVFGRNK